MILAILQVRMTSARLPGKAMALLRGEPMVWRQLERLALSRTLDKIVVATSADPTDDGLASYLLGHGQTVFRGAAYNLTERLMRCVEAAGPVSHVVRIKGDCPFVDPAIIDDTVRLALAQGCAYASNRVRRTYPKGLDVEVVTLAALIAAAAQVGDLARASPLTEVRARPERYPHAHCLARRDLSKLDWRVKTLADLAFARGIYDALHPADPGFGMQDILGILQGRQDLARWAA